MLFHLTVMQLNFDGVFGFNQIADITTNTETKLTKTLVGHLKQMFPNESETYLATIKEPTVGITNVIYRIGNSIHQSLVDYISLQLLTKPVADNSHWIVILPQEPSNEALLYQVVEIAKNHNIPRTKSVLESLVFCGIIDR